MIGQRSITARDGAMASLWALGSVVGARGLTFAAGIALARLLSPSDFGVVGMALIVTSTLSLFQDLGFGKALLRDGGAEEPAASTVFTVVVTLAAGLSVWVLLDASRIAHLFGGGAELARVLRMSAPIPLLTAIALVPATLLERRLDFRRRAWTEWGPAAAFAFAAVGAALAGGGELGLAAAHVLSLAVGAALALRMAGFRPRLSFDRAAAGSLFRFGRWVTLAALAAFMFLNLDRTMIGRFLGSRDLGVYLLAFGLANMPVTIITGVLGRVAFSAFAQLEREGREVRAAYLRILALLVWGLVPLAGLIGWVGPRLLPAVYGSAWTAAAPLLQILAVYGFFRGLGGLSGAAFLARRRSGLFLLVNVVQLSSLCFFLIRPPSSVAEVAIVFTVGMAIGGTLALAMSFRFVGVSQIEGWRAMSPALGAGAIAALIALLAREIGFDRSLPGTVCAAACALLVYGLCFLKSRDRSDLVALRPLAEPLRKAA
jgi:O-antigen/teichoic acid export membrane protein